MAPAEAFAALRAGLSADGGPLRARFAELQGHAELRVEGRERHFWSPTLGLEIRPREGGAVLHGLFGPHPAVWTFFMFVHFLAATGALIGLTLAWSQHSLGEAPWGLLSAPLAAAASGSAYGASLVGQRLARAQMDAMLSFLDRTLPEAP